MGTLVVVPDGATAARLNSVLQTGSYAVSPGGPTLGRQFDELLVLHTPDGRNQLELARYINWFQTAVLTRMAPGWSPEKMLT